jgi:hypothetical protein
MSGHYPFRELVKDFSPEQLEAVRQKKQELARIELHELLSTTAQSWDTDPTLTSIERIESCLGYLQQVVVAMGGELAVTAKFPSNVEVKIDLPSMNWAKIEV